MANYVTKDAVKAFLKLVVIEWDKRNNAKFAHASAVNTVKSDLDTLEDRVADINTDNFVEQVPGMGLSSNDFTDDQKKLLEELAKQTNDTFDADDVADIFS